MNELETAYNQANLTEAQIVAIRPIFIEAIEEIKTMASRESLRQTLLDQRRISKKSLRQMELALQKIYPLLATDQIESFNRFSYLILNLITRRKTDIYTESALSRTSPMLFYHRDQKNEGDCTNGKTNC
ncbi:MAG: hypothetical protein AAF542_25595 [Pseudomonadota bacterium]